MQGQFLRFENSFSRKETTLTVKVDYLGMWIIFKDDKYKLRCGWKPAFGEGWVQESVWQFEELVKTFLETRQKVKADVGDGVSKRYDHEIALRFDDEGFVRFSLRERSDDSKRTVILTKEELKSVLDAVVQFFS